MQPKTDIVYVLGNGSKWQNRELWYSLASVAKNLKGVGRVFVVGHNPGFLSNEVTFVPVREMYDPNLNPAANIISKLQAVCDAGVSENFLLMNDDFIILSKIEASEVPAVHKGKFSDYTADYFNTGNYRLRMRKTFQILKDRKLPDYNFGVHIPFPINRKKLLAIIGSIDWKSGVGISLRTIYGNSHFSESEIAQMKDPNVNNHHSLEELEKRFANKSFLSFNDKGLNQPLKKFLQNQFAETHKYAVGTPPETPARQVFAKRLPAQ